jgi:fatty acid desaturase
MRQMILGFLAALAVAAISTVPASACGGCWGCGYAGPCATTYAYGCGTACGAAFERLPDPDAQYHSRHVGIPQYYYVNQGPTYTGPGNFAPLPYYQEGGVTDWRAVHRRLHARRHYYRGPVLHSYY